MVTNVAYFDCFSGASGDMLLGALLDAGFAFEDLKDDVARLGLTDVDLEVAPFVSHGISGSQFRVLDSSDARPARNLAAVQDILSGAALPGPVIDNALRVFRRLAEAEAEVHGTGVEEVHFHELGAADSLVDIVGFCSALHHLQIDKVHASPLPLGNGRISTEHGLLPVPAPATLELVARAAAPTVPSMAQTELVTPTGAALLTVLAQFSRPAMAPREIGYGFGRKKLPWANALRVWLGEQSPAPTRGAGQLGDDSCGDTTHAGSATSSPDAHHHS